MRGGHTWNPKGSLNPAYKGGLIADATFVNKLYIEDKLSIRHIARKCGCSIRTAARWLNTHGIKTRDTKTATKLSARRGINNPLWNGCRVCPKCGGSKSASSFKRQVKVCIKCKDITGPNNPNWKGVADIMIGVRSWTGSTWRKQIFERDKFTCQMCGDRKGGNLHAHHKTSLAVLVKLIIDESDVRISELDAQQRNSLIHRIISDSRVYSTEAGVTLCEKCHINLHKGLSEDIFMTSQGIKPGGKGI